VTEHAPDGPVGTAPPPVRSRPYHGAHRAPRPVARRVAWVAGPLVVVAVVAALLLTRPWSAAAPVDAAPETADGPLAGLAADVADWVAAEVPADTPVTASEDVLAALGPAADRFASDSRDDALQVVAGDAPADALVLARFAADGTVLSVVDPSPAEPTAAQLDRRRSLGAAVVANPVAGVTGRGAELLRAGDVDPRLLGLLAGLVSRMDVHVADLPPAPAEPDTGGPPARRLLVDETGGERLTPGAAATQELVAYLEAQRPPFAPDAVEATEDGVLVAFDYLSAPEAVLGGRLP
jgi:hypothetical protein